MPSMISEDLCRRIVAYVEGGKSRRSAGRVFGVSASCAVKLMRRYERSGVVRGPGRGRPVGSGKLEPYRGFLIATVDASPDMTLRELAVALEDVHGVHAREASLSTFLIKAGYRYKKNAAGTGTRAR